MKRLLREPLLHFLLLGGLIFAVNAWRGRQPAQVEAAVHIDVTAGVIAWLREGFTRQWHREPDAVELRGLVDDHIREEVLHREALALGLDRDDTIVRRRMAQKMEFLTQDIAAASEPDDAQLRKYLEDHAERYALPARVSFQHVYFSKQRRGARLEADAREALAALAQGANEETLGDPFLREHAFAQADAAEIEAAFGPGFAGQVLALPQGEWRGPVASSYGLHLVRVGERTEPQPPPFEAVREVLGRDLVDERRRAANQELVERLKQRYQIRVDEAALAGTAATAEERATR